MLNLCAKDEAIRNALTEEVISTTGTRLVNAPYAAWKFAYRQLYDVNFGPRGARRVYGKTAVYTALKRITKEINYYDTHPAMYGCGMFGIETEIFPAWKIGEKRYSPYPQPGHEFVVLVPKCQDNPNLGPKLTWWVESPTAEGRLSRESEHLPLWRLNV